MSLNSNLPSQLPSNETQTSRLESKIHFFFFLLSPKNVCVFVRVVYVHVCICMGPLRSQKRALDSPEPALQAVVS